MDGLIATLEKNSVEQIRISQRTYKTYEFIDIRIYFQDDAGAWKPTKKGVTVSLDLWDDFKDAIARVEVPLTERRIRRRAKAAT